MSTALPADNFNPRDNTAGSFVMAASSQLPRAENGGQGGSSMLGSPSSPDCKVFNK